MLIIKGDLEKLKRSEFYNKECWDYPKEEVEMLKNDENYSDVVYLMTEDRVYETLCDMHDVGKLISTVNGEIINITSKEENEILEDVVKLFMEENDRQALEKLYEVTNDKLVNILLGWNKEYNEFIGETNTYAGSMYEDIMSYVWDKYKLHEIGKEIKNEIVLEDEVEELEED